MLFSISGILKVSARNFMKSRSHHDVAARGLFDYDKVTLVTGLMGFTSLPVASHINCIKFSEK